MNLRYGKVGLDSGYSCHVPSKSNPNREPFDPYLKEENPFDFFILQVDWPRIKLHNSYSFKGFSHLLTNLGGVKCSCEIKMKKDRKMENKDTNIFSLCLLNFKIPLFPIRHSFWWMITYKLNFTGRRK